MVPIPLSPTDEILCIGATCLSDSKLLTLILGTELSENESRALLSALQLDSTARAEQLRQSIHGPKLMAAVELGKRLVWNAHLGPSRIVRTDADAVLYARPHFTDGIEALIVFALDARLAIARVSTLVGQSAHHIDAHPARIFGPVLASGCSRFLVVHNHLSGIASPSAHDLSATQSLQESAAHLGLQLIDHVIVGGSQHFSFQRERLIAHSSPLYRSASHKAGRSRTTQFTSKMAG